MFLFVLLIVFMVLKANSEVLVLTEQNFEEIVGKTDKILVEFYAPWCGHCKALEPEYKAAAEQLLKDGSAFKLAKVDATVHEKLATKFGVQGFPTLKYFTNGNTNKPADYNGGRTRDEILKWIDVRTKPATQELTDKAAFEKFSTKGNAAVILFSSSEDHLSTIGKLAEEQREKLGQIGIVKSADLIKELNEVDGSLKIYPKFNKYVPIKFSGSKLSSEEITKFLNMERFPLFDEIGPENYKDYMERQLPLVWVSLDGTPSAVDANTPIIENIAKDFKGELSFVWVDNNKFAQHVKNIGITGNPGLLILGDPDKFLFEGEWNAKNLQEFFAKFKAGKLKAHMKSQPVPDSNDGNVFVLVGSQFSEVIGKDKDVLVEYYAPWCGHCKKLEPEYEKVGQTFKSNKHIVIAKIDATENDTPEQIQGFPTLIFYPKGQTKGIPYDGDRTSQAIISFIKDKASSDTKSDL